MRENPNVFHITGPPGTGKTERLAASTREAVMARGRKVAIASLTNTAAREIRERTGIKDKLSVQVGTLHKLCMEALGGISAKRLTVAHLAGWNEWISENHRQASESWRLSGGVAKKDSPYDAPAKETRGDRLLAEAEDMRHRRIPVERWRPLVGLREFYAAYQTWKNEAELLDFTDLIEGAARATQTPLMPDGKAPDTLVVDECQDSTALELHLVREVWGPHVERVILAGDPDQTLFDFRSADPRVFMDFPVPEANRAILRQSYRVPRAVHAYAMGLIRRIRDREDVEYLPRDEEGELIRFHRATARFPARLEKDLTRWLDEGTVMILGATQFGLRHTIAWLRDAGIPYHNPWAPANGAWNPLKDVARGTSTRDRFLAFLAHERPDRDWTNDDLRRWIPLVRVSGTLRRGVVQHLEEFFPKAEEAYDSEAILRLFETEEAAIEAFKKDPRWLLGHAKTSVIRHLEFLVALWEKGKAEALLATPKLTVGTMHSVKGGTADTVVLIPDTTPAMWKSEATQRGRDAQTRTFYVGATRARQRLVVLHASGPRAYPL